MPAKRKFSWTRKETPRQRLIRLRRQISLLENDFPDSCFWFNGYLCNYCQHFWYSRSYEGDSDYGCNENTKVFDDRCGEVTHCRSFAVRAGWQLVMEETYNQAMRAALRTVVADGKTKRDLIAEIKVKTLELETLKGKARNEKANLEWYRRSEEQKLKSMLPAYVHARLLGNKIEMPELPSVIIFPDAEVHGCSMCSFCGEPMLLDGCNLGDHNQIIEHWHCECGAMAIEKHWRK